MANSDNLAYDFDRFDANAVRREETQPAPSIKMVKKRRTLSQTVLSPTVVCAFLVVIVLIALNVYNRVKLNELTSEINGLQTELKVLQSENVRMTSDLESTISPRKLADLAEDLGMQKRDELQTERIYLYQDDKIEHADNLDAPKGFERFAFQVDALLTRFMEYISGN